MRMFAALAVVCAALAGCASSGAGTASSTDADHAAVRQALDEFSQLSGRADLPGVLAQFDDAADILLVGSDKGEVFRGRAAIEAWLGAMYKSNGFSWQMDRVEIASHGDTAWTFVEGKMNVSSVATGKLRFSAPYRFSAVLVKRGNAWKWRQFHGSAPGKE